MVSLDIMMSLLIMAHDISSAGAFRLFSAAAAAGWHCPLCGYSASCAGRGSDYRILRRYFAGAGITTMTRRSIRKIYWAYRILRTSRFLLSRRRAARYHQGRYRHCLTRRGRR